MKFKISINHEFSFDDFTSYEYKNINLKDIPKGQGVYILHREDLYFSWRNKLVFYIGATGREGLRKRAEKHRHVLLDTLNKNEKPKIKGAKKMVDYGVNLKHQLNGIYFSYYVFKENMSGYIPFVLEGVLIDDYEKLHGCKPEVNSGR